LLQLATDERCDDIQITLSEQSLSSPNVHYVCKERLLLKIISLLDILETNYRRPVKEAFKNCNYFCFKSKIILSNILSLYLNVLV
jgi:hypothetical protein